MTPRKDRVGEELHRGDSIASTGYPESLDCAHGRLRDGTRFRQDAVLILRSLDFGAFTQVVASTQDPNILRREGCSSF